MSGISSSAFSQGSSQDNVGVGAPARHNVDRSSSKNLACMSQSDGSNIIRRFNVNYDPFHRHHVLIPHQFTGTEAATADHIIKFL